MACPVSEVKWGLLAPPEPGQEADGEHTRVGERAGAALEGTSCGGQDKKAPPVGGRPGREGPGTTSPSGGPRAPPGSELLRRAMPLPTERGEQHSFFFRLGVHGARWLVKALGSSEWRVSRRGPTHEGLCVWSVV